MAINAHNLYNKDRLTINVFFWMAWTIGLAHPLKLGYNVYTISLIQIHQTYSGVVVKVFIGKTHSEWALLLNSISEEAGNMGKGRKIVSLKPTEQENFTVFRGHRQWCWPTRDKGPPYLLSY